VHIMRAEIGGNSWQGIATSDVDGRYCVGQDGGTLRLYASALTVRTKPVTLELDRAEAATHDFVLPPHGRVVLDVTKPDGSVPEQIYHLDVFYRTPQGGSGRTSGQPSRREDEHFVLDYIGPQLQQVAVLVEGHERVRTDWFEVLPDTERVIAVRLRPARERLTVRVADERGSPVPEYSVTLAIRSEHVKADGTVTGANTSSYRREQTDERGEIVFDKLWPDRFGLWVSGNAEFERQEVIVDVPAPRVDVVLTRKEETPRHARVTARIVGVETAEGGPGLIVSDLDRCYVVSEDGELVDSDGEALAPGTNWVVFVKQGYTAAIEQVDVPDSPVQVPVDLRFTLGEGGNIYGEVSPGGESPTSGARLYVYPLELWPVAQEKFGEQYWRELGVALAQGATVQEDGSFELGHLPRGNYVVCTSRSTSEPERYSEPIEVAPAMETGPVVLE